MGGSYERELFRKLLKLQFRLRIRKGPQILRNANNGKVKKVIAVVSGKGGVGKSLVTSMLAVKANKEGKKAAILDADITGPSIPKSFGLTERVTCNEEEL